MLSESLEKLIKSETNSKKYFHTMQGYKSKKSFSKIVQTLKNLVCSKNK